MICAAGLVACSGGSGQDPVDALTLPDAVATRVSLLVDVAPDELTQAPPAAGSAPVAVGLFISVSSDTATTPWTRQEVIDDLDALIASTDGILAQCAIHLVVESAQVVVVPEDLLDFQGNEPGSYGGHPPAGTPDPELFNYQQNERLTADARELFAYGKLHSSANAIAAFTVRDIEYYAEGSTQPTGAGGLSFPPNIYHDADDYPLRNSVLLVPSYGAPGDLPGIQGDNVLAHELGHMLLNTGLHESTPGNLMSGQGTQLTGDQCDRMNANLLRLFGDEQVPDPGPPS